MSVVIVGQRPPEEGLGRGQRHRRVVALVGAVQGEENLVVAGARRDQVDDPSPHADQVGLAAEVTVAQPERLGSLRFEHLEQRRVGLPEHEGRPRLHDACLLPGDVGPRRADHLHVVERHVGHDQ